MTTKNAGEKEQGMSEGPYKCRVVGLCSGEVVDERTGTVVSESNHKDESYKVARMMNLSHAHATAAAARRVRELEEALAAMVREFESGWPSHATESIGGLGHMPGESCNACRMMRPYKDAQSALAGKERTDGAE